METTKVTAPDFSLNSSWQCEIVPRNEKSKNPLEALANYWIIVPRYRFKSGNPTYGSRTVTFTYTIPSGSYIKRARIFATCGNAVSGCSVLSANGNQMKKQSGSLYAADITLGTSAGSVTVQFVYKANGSLTDTNKHTATVTFKDVYLQIEYDLPASVPAKYGNGSDSLSIPPQNVCLYDPATGKTYLFDGVIRIQHQLSMKIEEEPSKNKDEFVNNARNEPDKVTIDVVMSDVHTGYGALNDPAVTTNAQAQAQNATKGLVEIESSRSANAYAVLHALKEARQKLAVITPQYVYVDMLIASTVANQDETSPYGWTGQIVLQRAFEQKKKQNGKTNANAKTGGDTQDTPAFITTPFGTTNGTGNTGSTGTNAQAKTFFSATVNGIAKQLGIID